MTREEAIHSIAQKVTFDDIEEARDICFSLVDTYCPEVLELDISCNECLSLFSLDSEKNGCPCQEGILKETILYTIHQIFKHKKEMRDEKNNQD